MDRHFAADGRYTPRERRAMKHALDRSGKRIWRKKHNGHYAPPGFVGKRHHRHHHQPWWKRHYARHHLPGWKRHFRRHYYHHSSHGYPVYGPSESLSVDVEMDGFRFAWSESE